MADTITATLSNSSGTVDILITGRVIINWDKQLSYIAIPNKGTTGTDAKVIDLNRPKVAITIEGVLLDESGSSALTKRNTFKNIVETAAACTLAWGSGEGNSYTGNISKAEVREVTGRVGAEGSMLKTYEVMVTFFVGTWVG